MGYLLPALTDAEVREPARRRAQRAAAELREPPVRLRRHGDRRGAVSARSSVSLADDRRRRGSARGARSTTCARSSRPTTARATRRWRWPATSTPTRARAGRATTSASSTPGRAAAAGRRAAALAAGETCGWCSRIASSCRGSTWPGTRRRCSPTATPSWIWSRRCSPAARPRGSIARWSTSSASPPRSPRRRTRASSAASSRSSPPPRPGRTLDELERGDRRRDRRLHRRRPDRRRDGARAWRRPRRISSTGCRRSADSAASPIS